MSAYALFFIFRFATNTLLGESEDEFVFNKHFYGWRFAELSRENQPNTYH